MTLKDDLIAAKALIDTPEKWRRRVYKDSHGRMCAIGALAAATSTKLFGRVEKSPAGKALQVAIPDTSIENTVSDFNDASEHADIMALFDRAIEAAS